MQKSVFFRILALLALLIIVIGTAMSVYQVRIQRNQQIDDGREEILFLAKHLEPLLMWDDRVAMRQTLVNVTENNEFLRYAFIERGGRLISHSFPSGVPQGLLKLLSSSNKAQKEVPKLLEFSSKNGERLYDLSISLTTDDHVLHFGLDRSRIDRAIVPSIVGIALICCLFFLLVIYPSAKVADVITREVKEMTDRLQEANQMLEDRVVERTSDLREANERLAEGREQLAVTLRSIADGVATTDVHGRIVLLNRVAEELTDWKQEDSIGRLLSEVFHIIHRTSRALVESPFEVVFRTGGIVNAECQTVLIGKGGRERLIEYSGAPIRDADGRIVGVVLVFRDVTEKERLEVELQRSEKLESIGVLAGGIAHDFNNLLTAVIGNINLAQLLTNDTEPIYAHLKLAEEAVVRASDLASRLLTFSKGNAPVKRAHDIERIVREAAQLALSGSRSRCSFQFQPHLPAVRVDAGQIGQVIHNLLLNADQAMPNGGEVKVCCQAILAEGREIQVAPGLYVRVMVEDQGVGIPEDRIKKIFDPFFTTKSKGSGLGLAVVHSIMKNHGGHVEATSQKGKRTVFTLYLPTTGELPDVQRSESLPVASGKGRLLVMDDEEMLRNLLCDFLSHMGYKVECAADGEEAIDMCIRADAQGDAFLLLILDLTIAGGIGGKETIRRIRERGINTKAIATSGFSSDPVMANPEVYGFDASIPKPFNIFELCQTLQNVVATPHTTEELVH